MKIALVIERFFPSEGGNERSTAQIAERLIRRGHDVTVLTAAAPDGPVVAGATLDVAGWAINPKRAIGLLRFVRWAEHRIDRGDFDVSLSMTLAVAAHLVQPRSGTVRQTLAANIARRPTAAQRRLKRAAVAFNPKQLALLWTERRTFAHPRVEKIIAISRFVADQLFHHYTVPSRRIEMIPNAASVRAMDADERARLREEVRRQWRIGDADVAFVFAAINARLKGLGELLEAFARLRQRQPRAVLMIAGTREPWALRQAERLDLNDALRWVGPTNRMDALYTGADVTVLPTWYDPSSKVVLESLLHGVPAISTAFNGASQWIADPRRGQADTSPLSTAPADDEPTPHRPDDAPADDAPPVEPAPAGIVVSRPDAIDELTDAMARLCDADFRQRCADAARAGLDPRLDMDRHVERLEAVLRQVADRSGIAG